MTPSATEQYILRLTELKAGEKSLLRAHAGAPLHRSVEGFDLFTGLWWPLRQESSRAPRRAVAWLVAKLFSLTAVPHEHGQAFAGQLARALPNEPSVRRRSVARMDALLQLPLAELESPLRWGLDQLGASRRGVDWVELTDDLSIWEREGTRLRWAEAFFREAALRLPIDW